MTDIQFDQFIRTLENGAGNGFAWEDFFISSFSAIIGGLVAYAIARYQIRRGQEQQRLFMVDELKLQTSQKVLDSISEVDRLILNIVRLGYKSDDNPNDIDLTLSIQKDYGIIQNYLSDLNTVIVLYDFNKDEKITFNKLKVNLKALSDTCMGQSVLFNKKKALEISQKCLGYTNSYDHIVRGKHIDLINSMKQLKKYRTKQSAK